MIGAVVVERLTLSGETFHTFVVKKCKNQIFTSTVCKTAAAIAIQYLMHYLSPFKIHLTLINHHTLLASAE